MEDSEGFDEWYSQAFEGTKVASFNALEALSIENKVQELAGASPSALAAGEIDGRPRHTYHPETVYPQVWAVLGFCASLNTTRRAPSPVPGKDENLALTEALTDRCQRIVVSHHQAHRVQFFFR